MDREEMNLIIEQSTGGLWLPIGSMMFLIGVIVWLGIYVFNQREKANKERHLESEKRHKEHEDTISELKEVSTRLATIVERNVKDIEKLTDK